VGLFLLPVPIEPAEKRAVAFVDGQNLFYAAKQSYGYTRPNYDVHALVTVVCRSRGWKPVQSRFYTGVPDQGKNPFWHRFWNAKLPAIGRQGVIIVKRPLRYQRQEITLPNGSKTTISVGKEKGIDIRIALDVIRLGLEREYDVALIFSQDQDLSEVASEIRKIAREQDRWIKIASAYPQSSSSTARQGIIHTDWIPIPRQTYDMCIDHYDYHRLDSSK
jgi:uncharacterized LabA/DUF88 family protein